MTDIPFFSGVLAVDAEAIFKVAVFLIVGIFWILSQVWGAKDKAAPPPRRVPQKQRPVPPAQQAANAEISNEIEDFLKKASERREAPRQAPLTPPAPELTTSKPVRRPKPSRETRSKAPVAPRPSISTVAPESTSVAAQVQQHLDTRKFSERASHLTSIDGGRALNERVANVFDHQVGNLEAAEAVANQATADRRAQAAAAFGWAAFLGNPQTLRDAVILNEIFQRPESRW